jgi:hypothetical protein
VILTLKWNFTIIRINYSSDYFNSKGADNCLHFQIMNYVALYTDYTIWWTELYFGSLFYIVLCNISIIFHHRY